MGITSALGNLAKASQTTSTAKASPVVQAATHAEARATLKPDTVKLSMAGQAKLLHQQGTSPAQIASSLGLKAAEVDSYLGIKLEAKPIPSAPALPVSVSQPAAQPAVPEAPAPSSAPLETR